MRTLFPIALAFLGRVSASLSVVLFIRTVTKLGQLRRVIDEGLYLADEVVKSNRRIVGQQQQTNKLRDHPFDSLTNEVLAGLEELVVVHKTLGLLAAFTLSRRQSHVRAWELVVDRVVDALDHASLE